MFNVLIRDQYIDAIEHAASRFGREANGHVIGKDASLPRCIDYAAHYFYEGDDVQHYRYDRYARALEDLLQRYGDRRRTSTIVHIDIGCGPGLFSWVVHDHFRTREPGTKINQYGYDHAPAMTRLANTLWSEFKNDGAPMWTNEPAELIKSVTHGSPLADAIVSFGHVLVQTSDQNGATDSFVEILRSVRLQSTLLVAVDAHSAAPQLRRTTKVISDALSAAGATVHSEEPEHGSFVATANGVEHPTMGVTRVFKASEGQGAASG